MNSLFRLKIIDYNNLVYLYDKEFGWMIFDTTAHLNKRLNCPAWSMCRLKEQSYTDPIVQICIASTWQPLRKGHLISFFPGGT